MFQWMTQMDVWKDVNSHNFNIMKKIDATIQHV